MLYMKNAKVEIHPSESFFGYLVLTLTFFHVKHVHIFYWLIDAIFSTLTKNPLKKFKVEENF